MEDNEEYLINHRKDHHREYNDTYHDDDTSSRNRRNGSTSSQHHNNRYNRSSKPSPIFHDFKKIYRHRKIHILLVNCTSQPNEHDMMYWERTFNSLSQRLSGRYDDSNVFIHITDETFGIHRIAMKILEKIYRNIIIHHSERDPNLTQVQSLRGRNISIMKELEEYRRKDPETFLLIIGINTGMNGPALNHFKDLSREYNVKMVEKKKGEEFAYTPDFNPRIISEDRRVYSPPQDRKRQDRFDDDYHIQHEKEHRYQRTSEPRSPIISSRYDNIEEKHSEPLYTPKSPIEPSKHIDGEKITDREIIENPDYEHMKAARKIPNAFIDHEYYPNGELWKLTTILIYPNNKYPDYEGEEEESV